MQERGRNGLIAVAREIASLQCLTHPGIARLISAFRYTDGNYLVLEYAAKGDLHSHVCLCIFMLWCHLLWLDNSTWCFGLAVCQVFEVYDIFCS